MFNNNYPNLFTQYLSAEIKIKYKQIIIIKRVWVNVTVCVHENGHCRLVRVDDSAMCSETEHCLAGTGGRLNCVGTLDVAGAHFSWALDSSGPKSDWA